MRGLTLMFAAAFGLATSQAGAEFQCPSTSISVIAEPHAALEICDLTSRAIAELSTCGVQLDRPIQIEFVEELGDGCIGEYHCGDDRVTLLSPQAAPRVLGVGHPLSRIDPEEYLYSVLVHELTHAALESMPCPFSSCLASQEYLAYAMQMRSLSPDTRATLLTRPDFDRPILEDEINAIIAEMAPDVFMQKAWRHFAQQDAPCAFVSQVVSGTFLFDQELP